MVNATLKQDRDVISAAGFVHLLVDFALPDEPEIKPSFDACRWMVAGCMYVRRHLKPTVNWWRSPRHLADAILPPTTSLEAANPLKQQIRGTAPVCIAARGLGGSFSSLLLAMSDGGNMFINSTTKTTLKCVPQRATTPDGTRL